jgi:hypothetical protein
MIRAVSFALKLCAVFIALVIILVAGLWMSGFGFGVRVGGNIYADEVYDTSVYAWLLYLLVAIEAIVIAIISTLSRYARKAINH